MRYYFFMDGNATGCYATDRADRLQRNADDDHQLAQHRGDCFVDSVLFGQYDRIDHLHLDAFSDRQYVPEERHDGIGKLVGE
jgi:hypothetical protein